MSSSNHIKLYVITERIKQEVVLHPKSDSELDSIKLDQGEEIRFDENLEFA
jgi:hypothetical protein